MIKSTSTASTYCSLIACNRASFVSTCICICIYKDIYHHCKYVYHYKDIYHCDNNCNRASFVSTFLIELHLFQVDLGHQKYISVWNDTFHADLGHQNTYKYKSGMASKIAANTKKEGSSGKTKRLNKKTNIAKSNQTVWINSPPCHSSPLDMSSPVCSPLLLQYII